VSAGSSREEQADDQQSQHAEVEEHVRQCPGTEAEGGRDVGGLSGKTQVHARGCHERDRLGRENEMDPPSHACSLTRMSLRHAEDPRASPRTFVSRETASSNVAYRISGISVTWT
jgi:hypothetical protein